MKKTETTLGKLIVLLTVVSAPSVITLPSVGHAQTYPGESRQSEYLPGVTRKEWTTPSDGKIELIESDKTRQLRLTLPDGRVREYAITREPEPSFRIVTHPGTGTNKYALEEYVVRLRRDEFERQFYDMNSQQHRLESLAAYAENARAKIKDLRYLSDLPGVTLEQRQRLLHETRKDLSALNRLSFPRHPSLAGSAASLEGTVVRSRPIPIEEPPIARQAPRAYAASRMRTMTSEASVLRNGAARAGVLRGIGIAGAAVAGMHVASEYVIPALTGGEAPDPSATPVVGPIIGPPLDFVGKGAAATVMSGIVLLEGVVGLLSGK